MQDKLPLRVIGQSADGGLIWNTEAVSLPITLPELEIRNLLAIAPDSIQDGFIHYLITNLQRFHFIPARLTAAPRIPAASTFLTRAWAEAGVNTVMDA